MENGQPIYEPRSSKKEEHLSTEANDKVVGNKSEGNASNEKTGVVLAFSLPPAAYATMLLREFLRDEDRSSAEPEVNVAEVEDDDEEELQMNAAL